LAPPGVEHFDLGNRSALVMGVDRPAGAVIARAYAEAGARVALCVARGEQRMRAAQDLMQEIVDPSADVVWLSVTTVVNKDGIVETAPVSDEEWNAVRRGAIALVEAANLLQIPGRHVAAPGDGLLLAGAVPLHLSRRTFHPQEFGRQLEGRAVVEGDVQALFRLDVAQLARPVAEAVRRVTHRAGGPRPAA